MKLTTPVVLFIFNRPDQTKTVFESIALAKPETLFLIADGPRAGVESDARQCAEARKAVADVDWDCRVIRNYSDFNIGCGMRIVSGLDWVFEQTDQAIILEDDCLPDSSFYGFCQQLLDHYRDDERVMCISGTNFQRQMRRGNYSYYFSKYPNSWGWATWRRAWQYFDWKVSTWPQFLEGGGLSACCEDPFEQRYWMDIFNRMFAGDDRETIWDYQWIYTCWSQSGLTIVPNANLISNIGYGPGATHTSGDSWVANMPTYSIGELTHPAIMVRDDAADRYMFDHFYEGILMRPPPPLTERIRSKLLRGAKKLKRLIGVKPD